MTSDPIQLSDEFRYVLEGGQWVQEEFASDGLWWSGVSVDPETERMLTHIVELRAALHHAAVHDNVTHGCSHMRLQNEAEAGDTDDQ